MTRTFHYRIPPSSAPLTVQDFLRGKGYSHRIIARLKRTENGICLNGARIRATAMLAPGDTLTVTLKEKPEGPHTVLPSAIPLDVLYEDEDLLVINKPHHMPVHPSIGNHENTLANALAFRCLEKKETFPCRCINRLDRDTTGLLILAKHALSGAILSDQIKTRQIHRTYLAIVQGKPGNAGDRFRVEAPIARVEGSTIERTVDFEHGEYALTNARVLSCRNDLGLTLLEIILATGRTHQIRVHMKYAGYPLIGDFLYNPGHDGLISRQALHSAMLSFTHPVTGAPMFFRAPMPDDMLTLFEEPDL